MLFSDRLKTLMAANGVGERKLAELSGVAYGTVHGYTNNRRAPSLANTVKLARALGVDCTAFADCSDVIQEEAAEKPTKKKGKAKGGK